MSNVIEAIGLTKGFGNAKAVHDLSFSVREGTIHGLLGPNGSGKTTTIKMCVGLLRPDRGSITVFGETLDESRKQKSRVSYMPEIPSYPGHLTGEELLTAYGRLFRPAKDGEDSRVQRILQEVDLLDHAHLRIASYTKGMRQRFGLAQALIGDPELLILDEPSAGLDPLGMVKFRELMKKLAHNGKTILLSSHLLGEVEKLCDDVTILSHGRAAASGSVYDLIRAMPHRPLLELELLEIDEKVVRALRSLPFVEDLEVDGNGVKLQVSSSGDIRSEVSRTIVSCGNVILSMKETGASFEDMFVHYVTEGTRRKAAPTAQKPMGVSSETSTLRTVVRIDGEPVTGSEIRYELDIVNVSPNPIQFTEIKDLIPPDVEARDVPENLDLGSKSVRLEGLTLGPLEKKTLRITIEPISVGVLSLSPKIRYLDEFGEPRVHLAEAHNLFVTTPESLGFEVEGARKTFDYLASEFVKDSLANRLSLEASGWRSLVQVSEGAGISTSSLYGKEGHYGPALSELLSKGLVEARTFPKQRGRGGEAVKVRVRYESEQTKRYLNEMTAKKSEKDQKIPN